MNNRELQIAKYAIRIIDQVLPQSSKIVLDFYALNELAMLCGQVKREQIDGFVKKPTSLLLPIDPAIAMVAAHKKHEMMNAAVDEVQDEFPEMQRTHLVAIWCGVNAKSRDKN